MSGPNDNFDPKRVAALDPAAVRASASASQVTAPRTKLSAAAMAMLADRVNSV